MVEIGLGITAASIATLRPLFKKLHIPEHQARNDGDIQRGHNLNSTSFMHLYENTRRSPISHTQRISWDNTG
jgi:hypothetical protein